jgi:hypothetical protein
MRESHRRQSRPLVPPAWTPLSLSAALGVHRGVIDAAIKKGDLGPVYRIGVRRFIVTDDVISWLRRQQRVSP